MIFNKKLLLTILTVLINTHSFGHELASSFGHELASGLQVADSIEIRPIMSQKPGDSPRRTPVMVPIRASILPLSILVEITISDRDIVGIELSCLTTGEIVQEEVPSNTGWAFIPFSGADGSYTITFSLASGIRYYGEFKI